MKTYEISKSFANETETTMHHAFTYKISRDGFIAWFWSARAYNLCGIRMEKDYDNGLKIVRWHWLENAGDLTNWMTLTMYAEEL